MSKFGEADVLDGQGPAVVAACQKLEIAGKTYSRWRREYSGLKADQAKRLE